MKTTKKKGPRRAARIQTAGLPAIFIARMGRNPSKIACHVQKNGKWSPVTVNKLWEDVIKTAKGLVADGIQSGERIGIKAAPRYEWIVADLAIALVGAVSVPIYEGSSKSQVKHITDDACLTILLDDEALDHLKEFWKRGEVIKDSEIKKLAKNVRPEQLASILYTSGTTSIRPRGVELTHANFVGAVTGILNEPAPHGLLSHLGTPNSRMLQFLPLSHVLSRMVTHTVLGSDASIGFCPNMDDLIPSFQSYSPTTTTVVPRVLEKVLSKAKSNADGPISKRIFNTAMNLAIKRSHEEIALSPIDRITYALSKKLVYDKILRALGGKMQYIVAGGAPLDETTERIFRGMGLTILLGYGLTESTGPATLGRPGKNRVGSVGTPLVGNEIKISEHDGEVLIRGVSVTRSYYNGPAVQDWFPTGDLGHLDEDGYLYIDGRKKDLIVTSNGKNLNPIPAETEFNNHPLVSNIAVIGNNRPCIMALITLDQDELRKWLETKKLPPMSPEEASTHPLIRAELDIVRSSVNEHLSKAESIRDFLILPEDFSEANECLTPTLKLRRHMIDKKFAAAIDQLYSRKEPDHHLDLTEVFKDRPLEDSFFIGTVAIRGKVIFPKAYEAANKLREDVYTKVSHTDPKLIFDKYDKHSFHMVAIDGRGEVPKILYAFRGIIHDNNKDDIGLPLEKYFNTSDYYDGISLPAKRGEIGRFISSSALEKHSRVYSSLQKILWKFNIERYRRMAIKLLLYAKSAHDYGRKYPGYGYLADDLYKPLAKRQLAERISKGKICPVPNDGKERFVAKFNNAAIIGSLKTFHPIIGKITEADLKGNYYRIGGKRLR